jgi:polyprenyl-phospho-N-acetylgalactosaminyl synthase
MNSHIWVVIPAYNEEKVIARVLSDLMQQPYQVVVVDDGSTDHTVAKVLEFPVILLRHAANLGQGAALQTGLSYALRQTEMRYIVTFDADGQHHPEDIARLVGALEDGPVEVALGSRFMAGGQAIKIRRLKWVVLKLAIFFMRMVTGLALTDTHNGLRAFTREAAQRIHISQNGMAHASEILSQIAEQKMKYVEVPVKISYDAYSISKGQSVWNSINIFWEIITRKMR